MDSYTLDRIKHATNLEAVRRLLIKYFHDKGFSESFDRQLYPPIIQDLPATIPVLWTKVEVVPHINEIDAALGKAVMSWNMFVLGNHRMYLGDTYHNNLRDLARQIRSGMPIIPESYSTARRQTTPRRVIAFMTRVLGESQGGYVDLIPGSRAPRPIGEPAQNRSSLMGLPQQFFGRPHQI